MPNASGRRVTGTDVECCDAERPRTRIASQRPLRARLRAFDSLDSRIAKTMSLQSALQHLLHSSPPPSPAVPAMRERSVQCMGPHGLHRMAYWEWGDAANRKVLVCVHGLTRQGRDFDRLAQALIEKSPHPLQVICPDVVGRGRSEWLSQPAGYQIPQYAADMMAMLAQLNAQLGAETPLQTLDWVGTSMGGLIGMVLAGQAGLPLPAPIRRLVLNDVGPAITWSSVERMQTYVGQYGQYRDLDEAAAAMRALSYGFGPVPDDVWRTMSSRWRASTGSSVRRDAAAMASPNAIAQATHVVSVSRASFTMSRCAPSTCRARSALASSTTVICAPRSTRGRCVNRNTAPMVLLESNRLYVEAGEPRRVQPGRQC